MDWPIAEDYEIQTVPARGLSLIDSGGERAVSVIMPIGRTVRTYVPLEVPRLFRDFENLAEADPVATLAFAKKYGLLGLQPHHDGELIGQWADEISAVWGVLRRWARVKDARTTRAIPTSLLRASKDASATESARSRVRAVELDQLADSLTESANERFARHQLLARVVPIRVGRGRMRFALDQAPRTLIGVIWLQCMWALTGHQDVLQCENQRCRKWIELAPSRGRRRKRGRFDKRFCSDLCRATASQDQRRQGKARETEVTRAGE